jgi:hypothetical protein
MNEMRRRACDWSCRGALGAVIVRLKLTKIYAVRILCILRAVQRDQRKDDT